jgi:hypothetical protein
MIPRILFAAAFSVAVCAALGTVLLRALGLKLHRSEELFLGFNAGAACLSAVVFLLSVAHLAYTGVFLAAGIAILVTAFFSGALRFSKSRLDAGPRVWMLLFVPLYAAAALVYFVTALCPESSPDATMYHVALPALYLREHHIPAITTNMLAAFPEGAEMLYIFAFSIGGHTAPALVHLAFLLALPWGILSYTRRFAAPGAGVVGGLLFFLSPAVALDGTTAYVDVALASVIFAIFYVLEIWREEQNDRLLVLVGLLASFAYAIKYPGAIALIYALAVVLFRGRWRAAAWIVVPALFMMAPWILKDALVWNNPVAPFANGIFSNPYLYPSTEAAYSREVASLGGLHVWQLPYEITTRGSRTQGFVGPIFLLSPLALFALRARAGRRALAAAAMFALIGLAVHYARFLFPALVFLSLALGLVLVRWRFVAMGVVVLHALSAVPYVMTKYASRSGPRLEWPDWKAALRLKPESEYLEQRVEGYGLGKLMDANLAPGERVFSFRTFQREYDSRDVLVEWQSALGVRLGESLRAATDPLYQPTRRYTFSFAPVNTRRIRIAPTKRPSGPWSVSELRVFSGGTEYARSVAWRLRASPNPWDVQLAFDNSPLTRWASRRELSPDVYIEVDFGEPKPVDRVTVDSPDPNFEMAVETDRGRIAARTEVAGVALPPRLRRAAIEDLERQNIQALAIHDLDPGARDFSMRRAQWGIEWIGRDGRYSLYRLK